MLDRLLEQKAITASNAECQPPIHQCVTDHVFFNFPGDNIALEIFSPACDPSNSQEVSITSSVVLVQQLI